MFAKVEMPEACADLPISRRPIPVGLMFSATSGMDLSYSVPASAPVKIVGTGKDARLVFKNGDDGFSKDNLKNAFSGDTISFDITVSRASGTHNGVSYHAAQTVTRTIKVEKTNQEFIL